MLGQRPKDKYSRSSFTSTKVASGNAKIRKTELAFFICLMFKTKLQLPLTLHIKQNTFLSQSYCTYREGTAKSLGAFAVIFKDSLFCIGCIMLPLSRELMVTTLKVVYMILESGMPPLLPIMMDWVSAGMRVNAPI